MTQPHSRFTASSPGKRFVLRKLQISRLDLNSEGIWQEHEKSPRVR
jgi:hypothetical protein